MVGLKSRDTARGAKRAEALCYIGWPRCAMQERYSWNWVVCQALELYGAAFTLQSWMALALTESICSGVEKDSALPCSRQAPDGTQAGSMAFRRMS